MNCFLSISSGSTPNLRALALIYDNAVEALSFITLPRLPVGGIKEKVLAAKRAGLKEIIMCWQNEKDVEEINPDYIKGLRFHYVKTMNQVIEIALQEN